MTSVLPSRYGRVLAVDERSPQHNFIADRLITDAGLTAVAVADRSDRLALGVEIVRNFVGSGSGWVLGRRCGRAGGTVLVLATSPSTASTYREALLGNTDVTVAQVRPWDTTDAGYWPAIYSLAEASAAVVIDRVQGLAAGALSHGHMNALCEFAQPVVGLYAGNDTKPGIGGDVGWAEATHRYWVSRASEVHSLDTDEQPWKVSLPELSSPAASLARLSADQVRQLGELARAVDKRGGVQSILGKLFVSRWDDVVRVCGRDDLRSVELATQVGDFMEDWETGLHGGPPGRHATPPDEPPF